MPKLDPNLLRIIRGIGSADAYTAHAAINELSDILESQEKQAALRDYEEIYIQSILQQFKVGFKNASQLLMFNDFIIISVPSTKAFSGIVGYVSTIAAQYLFLLCLENVGQKPYGEHDQKYYRGAAWAYGGQ